MAGVWADKLFQDVFSQIRERIILNIQNPQIWKGVTKSVRQFLKEIFGDIELVDHRENSFVGIVSEDLVIGQTGDVILDKKLDDLATSFVGRNKI